MRNICGIKISHLTALLGGECTRGKLCIRNLTDRALPAPSIGLCVFVVARQRHGAGSAPSPYLLNIAAGNGHFNRSAENFDIQTKRRFATAANNIALRTVKRA